jgi:tetratricopeptide (TPR) repeat protein
MNLDSRLNDLVSLWQQAREQGQDVSAAELCRERPELLQELERQIDAVRQMNQLANADPSNVSGNLTKQDLDESTTLPGPAEWGVGPTAVPGYEIAKEIGRGGMGVVYRARQVGLNRIVALKMILAGSHAGESALSRFRTEAEAIARLQHPHIVQVFEVGQCTGLPYLALEYCGGGSLAQKLSGAPLPPSEAAALVETLAEAMQSAHERGVLHRDLKPGNVLFTQGGVPKITDFGLARKLDEQGRTSTGDVMGTPSYMAPEQAQGEVRETGPATDVYALGAILYECLTGRPPFKAATPVETVMQVIHEEVVAVRALQPKTPRDLETICLKCLRKQPRDRYRSANELAEDLARFRLDQPIVARPVGRLERAWKWARRRPAAAALLGVSLGAVLAVATLTAVYTTRLQTALEDKEAERQRAEENLASAGDAVNRYLAAVTDDPQLLDHDHRRLRQRLLEHALPFYQKLAAQPASGPRLLGDRGNAHGKLGRIAEELGRLPEAHQHYGKAIVNFEELSNASPEGTKHQFALAGSLSNLGIVCVKTGRSAEADDALQRALTLFARLATEHPGSVEHALQVAKSRDNLGALYRESTDATSLAKAETSYRQALDQLEQLAAQAPEDATVLEQWARTLDNLGRLYEFHFRGRFAAVGPLYDQAAQLREKLLRLDPLQSKYLPELASSQENLGRVYQKSGKFSEAETAFRKAAQHREAMIERHPSVDLFRHQLAHTREHLGRLFYLTDRMTEADATLRQALASEEELARRHPDYPLYVGFAASIRTLLGEVAKEQGNHAFALECFDAAIPALERLRTADEKSSIARQGLHSACWGRAEILAQLGRHQEAVQDWDRVLALDAGMMRPTFLIERGASLARIGAHARALNDVTEALRLGESQKGRYRGLQLFQSARVLALAAISAQGDAGLPMAERERLQNHYAAQAMEFLRKPETVAFLKKDAACRKQLVSDEGFSSLRSSEEFKKLNAEVEGMPTPKP